MNTVEDIISKLKKDEIRFNQKVEAGYTGVDIDEWKLSQNGKFLFRSAPLPEQFCTPELVGAAPIFEDITELCGEEDPDFNEGDYDTTSYKLSIYPVDGKLMLQYSIGIGLDSNVILQQIQRFHRSRLREDIEPALLEIIKNYMSPERRHGLLRFDLTGFIPLVDQPTSMCIQAWMKTVMEISDRSWFAVPNSSLTFDTMVNGEKIEMQFYRNSDSYSEDYEKFFLRFKFPDSDTGLSKEEQCELLRPEYDKLMERNREENRRLLALLHDHFKKLLEGYPEGSGLVMTVENDVLSFVPDQRFLPKWNQEDMSALFPYLRLKYGLESAPDPIKVSVASVLQDVLDELPGEGFRFIVVKSCPIGGYTKQFVYVYC